MRLVAHVEVKFKCLFERLDHADVLGNAARESDCAFDTYSSQQGNGARGDGEMNAPENILDLLALAQPREHFGFGEYRAGGADANRPLRFQGNGAELAQWDFKSCIRRAKKATGA